MTNGWIHQENITSVHIYTPNIGAPKYIKPLLTDLKAGVGSNTVIVGVFSTPLTTRRDHPDRNS